jgi:glycosyltransferase involved in cell wall biosynthesis
VIVPRVVIVHDYLTQRGGAERVVAELLSRWPDAELRTLLHDPDETFPVFAGRRVRTSPLQRLAGRVSHRTLLPMLPAALRSLRIDDADLVISSSSGWAHGVPVAKGIPHVCYCHNPARWLYDTSTYLDGRGAMVHALAPVLAALRRWDRRASQRPTRYVANSENVRERIAATYGREASVVHPPVRTDGLRPTPIPRDGYVLVLSRLLRYKRVDLAIEGAARAGMRVVVAGAGPERARLEDAAGPHATFVGRVPDEDLPALFAGARCFFLGGEEDFGITPLEANAAGRPVVAFGRGGALETVRDGETGVLFDQPTGESAAAAIARACTTDWQPEALAAHAATFNPNRFLDELEGIAEHELARARRTAPAVGRPALEAA